MHNKKNPQDITQGHRLNVLRELTQRYASLRGQAESILITHVLPTSEQYIELVNAIFPVQLVIAIPYSADMATLKRLEAKGIKTFLPSNVTEAFIQAGPRVEDILKGCKNPLVIQEVGGYLAGYTEKLAQYPQLLGIVEDTNNGHWRYQEAGNHQIPVLSMAQSPIKDIEDTVIGDSVIYSTERIFREEFHSVLQGLKSGVIGYGKIGTSTAIALKGRESAVNVYDIDPAKCIRARFEGHSIAPLHTILSECELIVGCTGKTSVRAEDIAYIRDNAILVSASAKNEEFDLTAFEEYCQLEMISPIIWRYTQADKRCFYLLNSGTPVNFRDRSILGNILDMIYSELFLCMTELAKQSHLPGLQHSPAAVHNEVAKTWLSIYERSFFDSAHDKVWQYPQSLSRALTATYLLQTKVS